MKALLCYTSSVHCSCCGDAGIPGVQFRSRRRPFDLCNGSMMPIVPGRCAGDSPQTNGAHE